MFKINRIYESYKKVEFLNYALEHVKFLYIPIPEEKKGTEGWISKYICDANEAKTLAITVAKWVDSVDNS